MEESGVITILLKINILQIVDVFVTYSIFLIDVF
mgnify:CR=1 FL=1